MCVSGVKVSDVIAMSCMSFSDWLVKSGNQHCLPFEDLQAENLAELLRQFYYSARTNAGELYSRSAMKGLRVGLQRHLQNPPFNKLFNIMRDRTFK